MHEEEGNLNKHFTNEMIEMAARLWMRCTVSLVDVRHRPVHPDHPLENYRMPSAMLIYAYGGSAKVKLNQTVFSMNRFGIFHGGKGTEISILPSHCRLNAFIVHYKAEAPPFYKKDLLRLLEQVNPFIQLYGYSPQNPIALIDKFQQMFDSWQCATAMNQFHAKNSLLQIVYQIYKDLGQAGVQFFQPDLVASVKRYLDERYAEPIMFQEIADMFAISGGQLTRLFKKREGKSLQEYLIQKRLEVARDYLSNTDATIKEIAIGCGFIDEINLFRMFKKHYKMTPSYYRKINTLPMQVHDIDNNSQPLYNEEGLDSLVKSQRDGDIEMNSNRGFRMAAFLLGMALVLSGASGASGGNAGNNQTPSAITESSQSGTEQGEQVSTKRFQHSFGEIEVPVNPERIAGFWMEDYLLALGTDSVVDSLSGNYDDHYLKSRMGAATIVDPFNMDFEALMTADPDLIVLAFPHIAEGKYDSFSKIAPTYVLDDGEWREWRSSLRLVGELIGRQEQAEQFIKRYEDKVVDGREKLSAALGEETIALMRIQDKNLTLYGNLTDYVGAVFYTELGLNPAGIVKKLVQGENPISELSMELIPDIDADHLFITVYDSDESKQKLQELYDSPLWKELPAVKNGNIYEVDMGHWMTSGAIASEMKVDDVLKALLK
jgi:iron complex transport system substrate-binding protein